MANEVERGESETPLVEEPGASEETKVSTVELQQRGEVVEDGRGRGLVSPAARLSAVAAPVEIHRGDYKPTFIMGDQNVHVQMQRITQALGDAEHLETLKSLCTVAIKSKEFAELKQQLKIKNLKEKFKKLRKYVKTALEATPESQKRCSLSLWRRVSLLDFAIGVVVVVICVFSMIPSVNLPGEGDADCSCSSADVNAALEAALTEYTTSTSHYTALWARTLATSPAPLLLTLIRIINMTVHSDDPKTGVGVPLKALQGRVNEMEANVEMVNASTQASLSTMQADVEMLNTTIFSIDPTVRTGTLLATQAALESLETAVDTVNGSLRTTDASLTSTLSTLSSSVASTQSSLTTVSTSVTSLTSDVEALEQATAGSPAYLLVPGTEAPENYRTLRTVEATVVPEDEMETDTWQVLAEELPLPRHKGCSAILGHDIYLISGGPDGLVCVQIFNTRTAQFRAAANLSDPQSECSAAASDDFVFVTGGYDAEASFGLNWTKRYDPKTDSWASVADMPENRYEHGMVAVGGSMFVIAGHTCISHADRVDTNTVWEYLIAEDRWETDRMSIPGPARQSPAVATRDGIIFVAGGSMFADAYAYNIANNSWSVLASLPQGVSAGIGAFLFGHFYTIAGWVGEYSTQVLSLDVNNATASWTVMPSLSYGRTYPYGGADAAIGEIVVLGGLIAPDTYASKVERFVPSAYQLAISELIITSTSTPTSPYLLYPDGVDAPDAYQEVRTVEATVVPEAGLETDVWQVLPTELPAAMRRADGCSAVLGHDIYFIGGGTEDLVYVDSVDVFNTVTKEFRTAANLSEPRRSCAGAAWDGFVYVAGGQNKVSPPHGMKTCRRYDPVNDSWSSIADMPETRTRMEMAAASGCLFVIGGWDGTGVTSTVYMYIVAEDRWETRTPLPADPRENVG